ncbi:MULTISPECIES: hypothetical protein [Pseudomonas]|uniref:Uncharacterized protein n=2 Tax=Pseudomonas TaxID=286 RepID=A0A3S8UMR1_9PSED|nr:MULTISPECIES: hypothetical protein [Pseudomonas]AZL69684.1 hypothetical protein EJA05_19040 [Pseudomonas oryziphila]UVL87743.1 hypothetical protein LOY51_18415 [Pseudomonas sichuanensis]
MSDIKTARKDATASNRSLKEQAWPSVAHYRRTNMPENTEIRREAQHISFKFAPPNQARFIVVPAGVAFFHITERTTGRVRGFRQRHQDACELARQLEA